MASAKPLYLKAFTVHDHTDIDIIKKDIQNGLILIIRVGPMSQKDVQELRSMVEELYAITRKEDAEIARLGDERIIIAPKDVRIWKPEYGLK